MFREAAAKLRHAALLRGYQLQKGLRHFNTTANIVIALFLRSFNQSERTYQAMCLRAGGDPADLRRAREDAEAYLARVDARQKDRVRAALEGAGDR